MKKMIAVGIIGSTLALLLPVPAWGFSFDPGGQIAQSLQLPTRDAESTVIATIQYFLALLGLISVIMILYGGIRYMTSGGNEDTIKSAKTVLKSAVIGLVIVLLSYSLLVTVVEIVKNVSK